MTQLTKQEALKELDQINERAEALRKYIEQAESKEPRKPKIGQKYWYINIYGEKFHYLWNNNNIDNHLLKAGNIFLIKEEADNCLLRLESMANRGEMPEEGDVFLYWDFEDGCPIRGCWDKTWFADWFIGSVHKTQEECRAWYNKYGKAFEALMK